MLELRPVWPQQSASWWSLLVRGLRPAWWTTDAGERDWWSWEVARARKCVRWWEILILVGRGMPGWSQGEGEREARSWVRGYLEGSRALDRCVHTHELLRPLPGEGGAVRGARLIVRSMTCACLLCMMIDVGYTCAVRLTGHVATRWDIRAYTRACRACRAPSLRLATERCAVKLKVERRKSPDASSLLYEREDRAMTRIRRRGGAPNRGDTRDAPGVDTARRVSTLRATCQHARLDHINRNGHNPY